MKPALRLLRAAATVLVFAAAPLTTHAAEPTPGPSPSPISRPATGDRITANIVLNQLRALGFQGEVSVDDKGQPRIVTTIDGYKMAIFFYGCETTGQPEDRACTNMLFYSSYIMERGVTADTMNRWNTQKRFARAYVESRNDGKVNATIEIDVYFADTGADPARMFREYFDLMRIQAREFRKQIDFS
jgi:Putative bacterial sensory transduction regulator